MSDLRDIVRSIAKKGKLSEDDVYDFEKEIREATLINIGYYPRARMAMCKKHGIREGEFDFLLWASCKDKIYRALIQAEHEDAEKVSDLIRKGVEMGYFRVMNKVSHRGVRIPKFYEVMPKLKDFQREFLAMLNPSFIDLHAKTFYRESPMWVRKNIHRSEKMYYENVTLATSNFSIK